MQITGTTTSEGDAVRAALERAAREMTTLRVREEVLDEAVASYRSVAGLRVQTDIPHGLRIHVLERRPVAALAGDGRRTAVSGDGVVLPGVQADDTLPSIDHPVPAGTRVEDERARAALAVAAAAPPKLLERAEEIYFGPEGLTADLTRRPAARLRGRQTRRRQVGRRRSRARCPERGRRHLSRPQGPRPGGRRRARTGPSGDRLLPSLNPRVRMRRLSTRSRDFAALQRPLRRLRFVDFGQEVAVTCHNPRP